MQQCSQIGLLSNTVGLNYRVGHRIGGGSTVKMNKKEDSQYVSLEKARVTDKNRPQIWTRGKILKKRRYLDNGAILQSLGTILRVAAPVT